jgi:hypothetical protein
MSRYHFLVLHMYYSQTCTFFCFDVKGLIKNIHAYTKRAFQCQQHMAGKFLIVAHQLAFEFMGVDQNAYSLYFPGTTEESCFESSRQTNHSAICRYICQKRKVRRPSVLIRGYFA